MAIGKKTGGRNFAPGKSGNPKGRPRLPVDIKGARELNRLELERMLNAYAFKSLAQIKQATKDSSLPIFEGIIAQILLKAHQGGDIWRADFVLNRLIGRVREAPPPEELPPPGREVTAVKMSFREFCINAGYPPPYSKQEEMRAFVLDEELTRILLGARGYGKTDYTTVLGTAYGIYSDHFDWAQGLIPALTETTLIISKSKTRNTAMIGEIANALAKAGVPLETENASCIRVEGLIGKDDSVEAIPLKASFRGRHPKRIIMDDPVTEEDTSEAMRTLVKKKYDEAYKLSKNIAIIGQPAHAFDLYAELRDILVKMEVPHGTIPELDADLVAMQQAGIDKTSIEMSYHLRVPKVGSMPFADLKFLDDIPDGDTAALLDPSDGGDYSALSIFRGFGQGIAVRGHAVKRAWYHWTELVDLLVAGHVKTLAFETNKHGEQPIEQLSTLLAPHGIRVVGVHSTMPKVAVIEAAASIAHMIHLSRKSDPAYTKQVTHYEYKAKFDDAPDSLARGLLWLGLIREKK